MELALRGVDVEASGRTIVRAVDLTFASGERVALLGPSGAGKSTCLRLLNGLVRPTRGEVSIDGRALTAHDLVALRRRMGWVIQDAALFPHLDVAANVGFVPQLLGWSPERLTARVDEMLGLVGLEAERFRHVMPRTLSGGERQRVGVARALAADPSVLLLDEPFAALDPLLRSELQRDLATVLRRTRSTVVLVTHDVVEALLLADRIVLLEEGAVVADTARAAFLAHPRAHAYAQTSRAAMAVLAEGLA